ncbi:MAG TPA: DNA mismatch repair protein MutS [Terriglobia bacterium]|nr:DNA mismatch repair protein MutS [Terriglobia bacterium]
MRALLMYRDEDFDPHQSLRHYVTYGDRNVDPRQHLAPYEQALIQDLELDTLLHTMAGESDFLFEVAERALLSGPRNDVETILYRQEVLKDCLESPAAVKEIYNLTVEAIEGTKRSWWDLSFHYASSVLYTALDLLETSLGMLRKLRGIVEEHASRFRSEAFTALFTMLRKELNDEYLAIVQNQVTKLRFREGVLLSAELGDWNESINLALRIPSDKKRTWLERIFDQRSSEYTFYLAERDQAGAEILSSMRHRGISRVAVALAQSADHVVSFFKMLRAELAFYCGCLNLHERLTSKGEPVCFPTPAPAGGRRHSFRGLYDVCLSLHMEQRIVGNTAGADGKGLVVITGANQGGKSTFLRSIGLAQLMMQSGMFVAAEDLRAELCPALFTHYKREEDASMNKGKLDEELARMSDIVDNLEPNSMLLFNESFAATNEREGSEIARQIVSALLEKRFKIFYVTHLYQFARGMFERNAADAMFLRAERNQDGKRTFRMVEGEPLDTSYGEDLYRQVFEEQGK